MILSKYDLPRFWLRVLTVTVGNFPLPSKLKSSCDRAIYVLMIGKGIAGCFHIPSIVSSSDRLITPAMFRMTAQVTGRLGITLVKESTDQPRLATAMARTAFEDMGLPVIDVFNGRDRLEEDINRCVPFLRKAVYYIFQCTDN